MLTEFSAQRTKPPVFVSVFHTPGVPPFSWGEGPFCRNLSGSGLTWVGTVGSIPRTGCAALAVDGEL